ncbi:MAG: hypothetical protein KF699_15915 [Phycisphaeraceae bacterium]|nr:hypothetical protein [Phycisphaeraceae bacterium]MBX3406957.1 hypothetical protein [Phycisphaeraceae bacterium]
MANHLWAALAALTTFAVAGTSWAGVNLVFNGGFEQGFAGWNVPPNAPPGNPNAANFQTPTDSPHSGLRYAQLSSTPLLFISQGVQGTVPGTEYELEFWLRRVLNTPGRFMVRWEAQTVFDQFVLLPDNTSWHQFSIPLASNFSGSFLEFGQMTFPNEFHIDSISVRQVPSPSAVPLFAIGGLIVFRRRR